jgi:protein OS-9
MYYTNGTFCHYTQSFRSVVAKIVCSPFHNNTEIIYIDEHPTCRYTVIVHTPQLCQHPLFGSHNYISPPSTIRCTPIVPEAVYKQYLAGMDNNEVPAAVYKEEEQKRQFPLVDVLEVLANSIAEKVGDELGSDGDITGNVDENGEGTLSQEAETVIDKLIDDTLGGMLSVSNVNKNGGDSSNENNNENIHENNEQKVTEKTVSIGKNDDNEAVDRKKKGRGKR